MAFKTPIYIEGYFEDHGREQSELFLRIYKKFSAKGVKKCLLKCPYK